MAKREAMLADGVEPYPVSVPVTTSIPAVRERFAALVAGEETDAEVGVAGRVVFIRNAGKLCFATLQAGGGDRLQAMVSLAEVGPESLAAFKATVDLGDHLFVRGRIISSKRGELSVLVGVWKVASKALRPLPVLHSDLSEEARVRNRSMDLIARPAARQIANTRIAVVRSLRHSLEGRGFDEIETPMLQTMHGGAAARPFRTHMNAFDIDLFLRIAPELFLKRALVGGFERVFEINRNFRNEGADSSHSPEFAMLEAYEAYGDYVTIATLTREIIQAAAVEATGSAIVHLADGSDYDLGGEWASITLLGSLSEAVGQEIRPDTADKVLDGMSRGAGLGKTVADVGRGKLIEALWEATVGHRLYAPTFVMDFPVETSPLTRQHRTTPGLVEKWDLYVRGFELATGYSELVDPVIQRERLNAQARLGAAGDEEAMALDEDFLAAIEYGMPPAGGMGMGLDRLLMAITGLGIRETILFPLVKPNQ
jgi:lysyl-tRNA synthetase class 2